MNEKTFYSNSINALFFHYSILLICELYHKVSNRSLYRKKELLADCVVLAIDDQNPNDKLDTIVYLFQRV